MESHLCFLASSRMRGILGWTRRRLGSRRRPGRVWCQAAIVSASVSGGASRSHRRGRAARKEGGSPRESTEVQVSSRLVGAAAAGGLALITLSPHLISLKRTGVEWLYMSLWRGRTLRGNSVAFAGNYIQTSWALPLFPSVFVRIWFVAAFAFQAIVHVEGNRVRGK